MNHRVPSFAVRSLYMFCFSPTAHKFCREFAVLFDCQYFHHQLRTIYSHFRSQMALFLQVKLVHFPVIKALIQPYPTAFATQRYFSTSRPTLASLGLDALDASKGDRKRIVILGSGWAGESHPASTVLLRTGGPSSNATSVGYVLSQRLSRDYQTVVISPRSYFVFTPLLNSTAVGTLEFRTALEPVRSRRKPNVEFIQGWADDVDLGRKTITVEESVVDQRQGKATTDADPYRHSSLTDMKMEKFGKRREGKRFEVDYDKLVIAVGCYSQTFGTKGVKENAYFMKDVGDARRVRKRVLECFEIASLPTTNERVREHLLRFAIIGGGPTGMEFAAELSDLVHDDLSKIYPRLASKVKITVHDVASKVLSMFDDKLSQYAMKIFSRQGIAIKTNSHVEELRRGLPHTNGDGSMEDVADAQGCYTLTTAEDGDMGIGMCVWSTGVMMNPFVKRALRKIHLFPSNSAFITSGLAAEQLPKQDWMIEKHPKTGAIIVDDRLRVRLCSQSTTTTATTATARETSHDPYQPASTATLTDIFALGDNAAMANHSLPATAQTASQQALWLAKRLNANARGSTRDSDPFTFRNLGIMAYVGDWRGILESGSGKAPDISGRAAWLIWRGAYLTKSVSWRNKVLIPTYW
ncbi:MAG: hypothetical protein Q9163_001624 [Psora crenata]